MSRDPRRRREATARRAHREFITTPDDTFTYEPEPGSEAATPVPWADIVAMYAKMLPTHLRRADHPAWALVREPTDIAALVCAEQALEAYRAHLSQAIPLSDPDPHYTLPPERLTWSPQAYAALRGLTGPAADMFTEIATAIQNAKESTPW